MLGLSAPVVTSVSNSKRATLLFEYAVMEVSFDETRKTDCKDLTFDFNAAPAVDEDSRQNLVAALAEDLQLCSVSCFAYTLFGNNEKYRL